MLLITCHRDDLDQSRDGDIDDYHQYYSVFDDSLQFLLQQASYHFNFRELSRQLTELECLGNI